MKNKHTNKTKQNKTTTRNKKLACTAGGIGGSAVFSFLAAEPPDVWGRFSLAAGAAKKVHNT